MKIMKSIRDYFHDSVDSGELNSRIVRLRELLNDADAILIGAGAGFSSAAGL
jgi:hypothetical protein